VLVGVRKRRLLGHTGTRGGVGRVWTVVNRWQSGVARLPRPGRAEMKVRTAVGIVVAIVVAKAALTWVALEAWGSLPKRLGFVDHWRIELGPLAEWLAAIATVAAAGAALLIATLDRNQRTKERAAAQEAQARLVIVEVRLPSTGRAFAVDVRNFGTSAVLDVTLDSARFDTVPGSTFKEENKQNLPVVLDRDRRPHIFYVDFVGETGNSVIPGTYDEAYNQWESDDAPDPSKVTASVCFTDAEGTRWKRSSSGSLDLTGLRPSPTSRVFGCR
jgi:hypothetical protein